MADISKELGSPGGIVADTTAKGAKAFVVEPLELNPDLAFPNSIPVFDEMRRTDGQVGSLLRACTLPILGARWDLVGDDVRPEVTQFVRTELGIAEPNTALARRRRQGIVWTEHLNQALLCLPLGFMPFEQVYEPGPPRPDQEGTGLSTVLHLRKLAPRLPRTITQIHVARDGGLVGVSQAPLEGDKDVLIPVDRLVMYTLDREGADWSGTSLLRTSYKHWLIKDKLLRLSAQIVERNGMGVPVITYDGQNVDKAQADAIVSNFRAGATAGVSLPVGADLKLLGVTGSTEDPLPLIEHHNQAMAKAALAMFLDLGHDAGARSLGETFLDFFTSSLQSVADMVAATATEHVIRDLVELNFGPDEPYPALSAGNLSADKGITTSALKELVDAGIIHPDAALEAQQRAQYGLPEALPATARAIPAPTAVLSAPDPALDRATALLKRLAQLRGQHV